MKMSKEIPSSASEENQAIMKESVSQSFKSSQTQHEASKELMVETNMNAQGDTPEDADGLASPTTEKSSPESYSSAKIPPCQDILVVEEATGDDQPFTNQPKKEAEATSIEKAQDVASEREENIEKQNVVKILAVAKEKKSNKKRLLSDIHQVMSNDNLPFEMCQVDEDRFDQWLVRLKGFDGDSELSKDMKVLGLDYIEMQMNFPDDVSFPLAFLELLSCAHVFTYSSNYSIPLHHPLYLLQSLDFKKEQVLYWMARFAWSCSHQKDGVQQRL